jgi:hypothetical protein
MSSNLAASVRARLSNQAKEKKRPFQELLQYYGIERFLYRFSQSQHSSHFGNSLCRSQGRSRKDGTSPTTRAHGARGLVHLRGPYRNPRGFVPALVAAQVEWHGRRGSRRGRQRNDATSQGAWTSESPSVDLRAFV